jgi:hypothetical protein
VCALCVCVLRFACLFVFGLPMLDLAPTGVHLRVCKRQILDNQSLKCFGTLTTKILAMAGVCNSQQ